jgi:hypothetical protein
MPFLACPTRSARARVALRRQIVGRDSSHPEVDGASTFAHGVARIGPKLAPQRDMASQSPSSNGAFWYVKVRHTETGTEIQHLFSNGAMTEPQAVLAMQRYLLRTARAEAEVDGWEIVEVSRWPQGPVPR